MALRLLRRLHGDDDEAEVSATGAAEAHASMSGMGTEDKIMHGGGDTFGHVVPGTFYIIMGLLLVCWTRYNLHGGDLATNGGAQFLKIFGWSVMGVATTGFLIEGLGGLITVGNFWHQLAHETMYGVFLVAGVAALLESAGRMPYDSWRVAMAVAFVVEGVVFYGHHLEQEPVEGGLHYIMYCLSLLTALCFLWASRDASNVLAHLMATAGMVAKGLWFYVVANILYSGKYGENGRDYMVAMAYTQVGLVVCVVMSAFGCLFVGRRAEYASENVVKYGAVPMAETA